MRKLAGTLLCALILVVMVGEGWADDWEATIQVARDVPEHIGIDNVIIGVAGTALSQPKPPPPPSHSVRIVIYEDLVGFAERQKEIITSSPDARMWLLGIDPRGSQDPAVARTATVSWSAAELDSAGTYQLLKIDPLTGAVTDTLVEDMSVTTELQVTGTLIDYYAIAYAPAPCLLGDVSGNWEVTAFDAALLLQYVVGMLTLPDAAWPCFVLEVADVSGNGVISAYDAALIMRYTIDLIPSFPAEGGSPRSMQSERTLTVGPVEDEDSALVVPLVINDMEGVVSGEIELTFDPAKVMRVEIIQGEATFGYMFASNVVEDKLLVAFAAAEAGTGSGSIAEIRLILTGPYEDLSDLLVIDSVNLNDGEIDVQMVGHEPSTPAPYRISQNYPNPFNPGTTITYTLPEPAQVHLAIYNFAGQWVRTLIENEQGPGEHAAHWDGLDSEGQMVSSGVYLYRVEVRMSGGVHETTRKMLLIR